MDSKRKEFAKLGVVGLCLALTVLLVWHYVSGRSPEGIEALEAGQMIVTLCFNSDCKAQADMDKRVYYQEVDKLLRQNPQMSQPALPCSTCEKFSVFRAVVCPKCDHTFRYGGMQRDAADRCPKCKYSEMEEARRQGA